MFVPENGPEILFTNPGTFELTPIVLPVVRLSVMFAFHLQIKYAIQALFQRRGCSPWLPFVVGGRCVAFAHMHSKQTT